MGGSGGRFRRTCQRPDPVELSLRPPFVLETKDPIPVAAADDPPGKIAFRTASSRRQRRLAFARVPSPEEPEMLRHWRTLEDPMGKIGSGRCSTRLSYARLAPHGGIRTPDHLVRSDETASCTTIGFPSPKRRERSYNGGRCVTQQEKVRRRRGMFGSGHAQGSIHLSYSELSSTGGIRTRDR